MPIWSIFASFDHRLPLRASHYTEGVNHVARRSFMEPAGSLIIGVRWEAWRPEWA